MTKLFKLILLFIMASWNTAHASSSSSYPTYNPSEYAIVFFFTPTCSYCHLFAPTLKSFAQKNGLTTYAFSYTGEGIPGYEVPIPITQEIAASFFENPRNATLPATFLINVNSRKSAKMTVGNVSASGLQQTYDHIRNDPEVIRALQP